MKVERWEEESDEEWTERRAEEIAIADNPEISKYFVNRDPYDEAGVIVNYIGEDGWMWKEHPEGPFMATQIIEWKNKAKKYDGIQECVPFVQHLAFEQVVLEYKTMQDKLEAIRKQNEAQLKEVKEYLGTHNKPEPHDVEMSRYWLEKGIYATIMEQNKILEGSELS